MEPHGQTHTKITLTESERQVAEFIAKRRFDSCRESNIVNNKKGPQSNYETDLEGMASELAAAKALNVWPDLTEEIQAHDLIYNGITIDVKTTKYKTGDFDYEKFYQWCIDKHNEGHQVFISEYYIPEDRFECVWQKKVNSSLTKDTGSKKNIEKLWIVRRK